MRRNDRFSSDSDQKEGGEVEEIEEIEEIEKEDEDQPIDILDHDNDNEVDEEDEKDEKLDEEARKADIPIRSKPNRKQGEEKFELLHGNQEDIKQLELRYATYDSAQWAQHADLLLRTPIDQSLSNRDLMGQFTLLYHLFCFPFKDEYAVVDRVKAIYPHISTMKEQYLRLRRTFGCIHYELIKRNLIENETKSGREIERMLTNTAFGMKMIFQQVVHNRLLQKCGDKSIRSMLEEMSPLSIFKEFDNQKLKKHQQLLHFYYQKAFELGYRKNAGRIYKPKENKDDQYVYAYEYVFDVADFVFQAIFPLDEHLYWFECLTTQSGNAKHCIDILTRVKCEWLPDLERNRDIYSFQNGLYVLSHDKFYYFQKKEGKHWVGDLEATGVNMVAVKYHDIVFDEEGMEADMSAHPIRTFMSIKMDPIYKVLMTQGFDVNECMYIFALLGRMLHPIGAMDNWGVFVYFLGLAGTGKSSLLRLLASLFDPNDVGLLNNSLQKTFSIESIADKLIYFGLDIDEHFQMDQATFQSMVVGEEVSVLRKHKTPITLSWKSQGGFAGNKLPSWTDNGGSLTRRLIIIEFMVSIAKVDPNLFDRCLLMKDRFLKVINAAYHHVVREHSHKSIKEVLPAKFRESEKRALLELNILAAFMKENCEIDPKFIAPWKDFQKAYKMYCKRNSLVAHPLKYAFYSGVFCKTNCTVVENPNPATDAFQQKASYVKGLKLKEAALEGAE